MNHFLTSPQTAQIWIHVPGRTVPLLPSLDSSCRRFGQRSTIEPAQRAGRSDLAPAPAEVLSCSILVQDSLPYPGRSHAAFQEAMEDGRC